MLEFELYDPKELQEQRLSVGFRLVDKRRLDGRRVDATWHLDGWGLDIDTRNLDNRGVVAADVDA